MDITLEYIKESSPHLAEIVSLYNSNRRLLGFLPEGAFADKARDGHILAAIDESGHVVGYLLYRMTRLYAAIVHLCVSPENRNDGVATKLVTKFQADVDVATGILVTCRAD